MSDCRVMIVESELDLPCHSFTCDEMGTKRYYVGNPYSGGLHNYPLFCEQCIKHLVTTIPPALSPTGADVEKRIRTELTAEYDELLHEKIHQIEKNAAELAERMVAVKLAESQETVIPVIEEEVSETATQTENAIHRCLDCGDDFETEELLNAHLPTHDGTPVTKRSRKPDTAARKRQ